MSRARQNSQGTYIPANTIDDVMIINGEVIDSKLNTVNGAKLIVNSVNGDRLIGNTVNETKVIHTATPTANKFMVFNGSTRYPAADGSLITNLNIPSVVTSPNLAVPGAFGTATWNHGQGTRPKIIAVNAICVVADGGYAIGNVISLNHTLSESDSGSGPQNDGISVRMSTTQVVVRVANRNTLALRGDNGGNFTLVNSRWNFIIEAIF